MQIAVAQMSERQRAGAGKSRIQAARIVGDEGRHQIDGHADVVLQSGAFGAFRF
jgi:AICAR transformylase/IMP cyclohydrolase PurH